MDMNQSNIPDSNIIDGSKDFNKVPEGNEEAYRKLMEESEKINSILYESEIVEDGQGSQDIPEEVEEMGDGIASTLEFDGRVSEPLNTAQKTPSSNDMNDISLGEIEKQFENHSNYYDQDARTQWLQQLESERPHLLERNQQLEKELIELRRQKEAFEDEEIKNFNWFIICRY